jgi:hypothetical protein
MFGSKSPSQLLLEDELIHGLKKLKTHSPDTEGYAKTLDQVVRIYKIKEEQKSSSVSRDTLALVGANLLGIVMIIKHENLNVITSRAMNLILKPR